MKFVGRKGWYGGIIFALLMIPGCKQFTVETVIRPDGSGTRAITLEAGTPEFEAMGITLDQYRALLGVSAQDGWRLSWEEGDSADDKRAVFTRHLDVSRLENWAQASGDLSPCGALEGNRYADVRFANDVKVTMAKGARSTTYLYEETFDWQGLREALVGFVADRFAEEVAAEFPSLSPEVLAELRGLMAGLTFVDFAQLFDVPDEERASLPLVKRAGIYGARIAKRGGIATSPAQIEALAAKVLEDEDSRLEGFLRAELPGVEIMALTDIELSVMLPGTIVESNADEVEGNVATWEVGILDALRAPVILGVTSELPA